MLEAAAPARRTDAYVFGLLAFRASTIGETAPATRRHSNRVSFPHNKIGSRAAGRRPQDEESSVMKFRRMACDCCKSSEFPSLCKSPTYVMSEVVEDSNIVFLLMSKGGRASCGGPLVVDRHALDDDLVAAWGHDLPGPADVVWPGRRAEEILDACWRPTPCLPSNDDFEDDQSPIRRNQRLLEEGSGFWPRRASRRDPDGALREWD